MSGFLIPRSMLQFVVLLTSLALCNTASAAVLNVNSLTDDGSGCTLRDAVASVNNSADTGDCVADITEAYGNNDRVDLTALTGNIQLDPANGQIEITAPITITGPGPDQLSILGNNTATAPGQEHRIFQFSQPDNNPAHISGLTLTQAAEPAESGGAILSHVNLTLENMIVTGNLARFGGGLMQTGAGNFPVFTSTQLTLINTVTSHNSADVGGGIMARLVDGNLTIRNSQITDNQAVSANHGPGGGLVVETSGDVDIRNSSIARNQSMRGGAGMHISCGNLYLHSSTIADNHAISGWGGGIKVEPLDGSQITLVNNSISGNSVANGNEGAMRILGNQGFTYTTTLINNSIIGNASLADPGCCSQRIDGIYFFQSAFLYNNIITNSHDAGWACSGSVTGNNNLITSGNCNVGVMVDGMHTTPAALNLEDLAHNGGPTQTHAPGAGSVAIDAGDNRICAGADVDNLDQRGAPRPAGAACDAGSFEAGSAAPGSSPCDTAEPTMGCKVNGNKNQLCQGTDQDDKIIGTRGDDVILGGEGNDRINGGKGNDLICGQAGDDRLKGSSGDDQLIGGEGNDSLKAGKGNDVLEGGSGDDALKGSRGSDTCIDTDPDTGFKSCELVNP